MVSHVAAPSWELRPRDVCFVAVAAPALTVAFLDPRPHSHLTAPARTGSRKATREAATEVAHGDGVSGAVAGGDCRAATNPVRVRVKRGAQVGKALLHDGRKKRRHHSGLQR